MDIATVIGILVGFFIIVGSIIVGGGAKSFVHIPSMAITVGGMICASLIHFSLSQVLGTFSIIKKTVITSLPSKTALIQNMINFATINRRYGSV